MTSERWIQGLKRKQGFQDVDDNTVFKSARLESGTHQVQSGQNAIPQLPAELMFQIVKMRVDQDLDLLIKYHENGRQSKADDMLLSLLRLARSCCIAHAEVNKALENRKAMLRATRKDLVKLYNENWPKSEQLDRCRGWKPKDDSERLHFGERLSRINALLKTLGLIKLRDMDIVKQPLGRKLELSDVLSMIEQRLKPFFARHKTLS